jgi:hypothetical protein
MFIRNGIIKLIIIFLKEFSKIIFFLLFQEKKNYNSIYFSNKKSSFISFHNISYLAPCVPGITPHLGAKFFVIYKTNLVKKK